MAVIEREIYLKAPVEKVFAAVADSKNIGKMWSNISQVKNIQPLPSGGESFEYVYRMAGINLNGTYEEVVYEENKKIIGVSKVGIETTITWEFATEKSGTHVSFHAEYRVPIPLIGKVADNILVSMNELDVDAMLNNLRSLVD